jgi:lipopolysaccharide export system protein LptA
MRRKRGLLLAAIVVILGAVAVSYYSRRERLARQAPPPPQALPREVEAVASDWVWSHTAGGRPVVEVRAKQFRQVGGRFELERVDLRLYHNDGSRFDGVKSARAEFDVAQGSLYSEGEVEITMGLPAQGPAQGRLVLVRSSGVTFESRTGRASTERLAAFSFDQGQGQAVGASYDPGTRELHMKSQVELNWRGRDPASKPMKLEAGELIYRERDALVSLSPWARLTRENTLLEAAGALVFLADGAIQKVESRQARGTDRYPDRQLEYAAEHLTMHFSPRGEVEKITADGKAGLVALSEAARTTVRAERVDLDFDLSSGQSVLRKALAMGSSSMESVPLPRPGRALPETRVLRSEVIQLAMRAGGREIDSVETHAPGEVEFLPNRPEQRHRRMAGERMWISYGPENRVRSVRAVEVRTSSEGPAPPKGKPVPPPALTSSKDLAAEFDSQTGQLARLEQWGDFRYEEGARKAQAGRAVLEEAREVITLEQNARVWDAAGSTAADWIRLEQRTGDVTAQGKVISSRLPDRKGGSSGLLSTDQPLEARAGRMITTERRQKVRYEGSAVLWQGANRLRAETVDIDRAARRLEAHGGVWTQFADAPKGGSDAAKRKGPPVFAVVESADLNYTEADRLARYSGGARLRRAALEVRAGQIRAYFREASAQSSLDRAYADGQVEVVEQTPDRVRKGLAEHAEYYADDSRIVLWGGAPSLADSLRGQSRGERLTYWADDDKLLINGDEQRPVVSRLRRQK